MGSAQTCPYLKHGRGEASRCALTGSLCEGVGYVYCVHYQEENSGEWGP